MAYASNLGVIQRLTATGASGANTMVVGANNSEKIALGLGARVTLSVYWVYSTITSYIIKCEIFNDNYMANTNSSGLTLPVDPTRAVSYPPGLSSTAIPILSVAQNDDEGGGNAIISHTYSSATGTLVDLIQFPNPFVGTWSNFRVVITTAGVVGATSSAIVAVDCF